MTIDVSDNNPRINYSIAEGVTQTVFSVPFEFFEDSNVYIYVDGVLKTEGLDYTLTGGDGSTGTLTFVTATPPDIQQVTGAAGGTVVTLVRHVSLERVTDFVAGQDINRAALNEQLDTIVAQIADLDDRVDRTIHLNDSEVAPSMLLTDDRKGRVMAFNSSTGAVEAGPLSNDIATIADNIAEILAADDEAAAAAASATAAATSASAASTSATAAQAAQTAAELAETNAETAETNAETAETNAAASAAAALASETAASTSETNAAASEAASSTSETNAAASAAAASTSETNAATSADEAEAFRDSSALNAATSSASATNAQIAATAAAASETAAAASEAAAATSETNAAASKTAAAASETAAASSASSASTSASNAASSASSASASADAALAALDNFDDRYLGQKTSDPATDNDGDALVAGALYFNTTDEIMKVYDGSLWVAAYASLSGAMFGANNLSDVSSASDSRNNLGLGTAATTASTDYATAAQGALADSAVQTGDSPSFVNVTVSGTVDGRDVAADGSKLDGIEAGADVTDTANVTAAGALMDSEVTNLAQVKAFDSSDYATAAQGSLADSAVQPDDDVSFGTVTAGDLILNNGSSSSAIFRDSTGTNGYQLRANVSSSLNFGFLLEGLSGKNIARFDGNGDISFYEDTGTTPKFFWDASAEELQVSGEVFSEGFRLKDSAGAWRPVLSMISDDTVIETGTTTGTRSIVMKTEGAERMRIDSSGNVGIGTSSPVASLDVYTPAGTEAKLVVRNGTSTSPVASIELRRGATSQTFGADSYGDYRLKNEGGNLSFDYGEDGTTTERMRLDSSGNLLVGTTSGSDKVVVNGTVNATAFVGDGSALTGISTTPTTADVLTATAGASAGAVGTYASVVHWGGELAFGATIAGSSVHPLSISKSTDVTSSPGSTVLFGSEEGSLSGTWRVMASGTYSGTRSYGFLALRIS